MVSYWWVNQNQTYSHEVGGGYLWSPKVNANGARNQFYYNMSLVQPGDIVFSYAGTYIKAVGVVMSEAFSALKPKVFGQAGSNWNADGWQVSVEFTALPNPFKPKNHMGVLGPTLPEKYSPLRSNGDGLQGVYLAHIPQQMADVLLDLISLPDLSVPVVRLEDLKFSEEEQELIAQTSLEETVKATLVMARRGQGIFRQRVRLIEPECRVTGVSAEKFLVASHIKPWAKSDNQERLDGNNGLFLSPHIDKLFNDGFITFTAKGSMEVSPKLDLDVLDKWKVDPRENFGRFNSDQAYFLNHHNEEIFKAA